MKIRYSSRNQHVFRKIQVQVPERLVNWWEISCLDQKSLESSSHTALCSFYHKSLFVAWQRYQTVESLIWRVKNTNTSLPDPVANKQKTLMFSSKRDTTGGTTTEKDNKEKRQLTLDTAMSNKDTVKAEIIWLLEVLKNKYSYWSCASKSSVFAENFKESETARSFTLVKTKCSYVICYDVAPYYKDRLMVVLETTVLL